MTDYPPLRTDPRTPKELDQWLAEREERLPGVPLTAREMLMVQRVGRREDYSIT